MTLLLQRIPVMLKRVKEFSWNKPWSCLPDEDDGSPGSAR